MTYPNGGQRDENSMNRRVIRDRFKVGQTLTLEEYKALNPDNAPLTEREHHYGQDEPRGTRRQNMLGPAPRGIHTTHTGVAGRVRSPGPST